MVRTSDRIDELFHAYAGPSGGVDMRGVFRLLWKTLTNTVSAVDLAGVFAVSIPNTITNETLTQELFQDFFKAYARLKYPLGSDFCEKLLDEIRHVKGTKPQPDSGALSSIADKNAVRVLLKYDLPLRRAFSTFCAQAIRVGSSVSWDEVKSLSLGMELDGFLSFSGTYNIIPQNLSGQQCEVLFREIVSRYVLNVSHMHSSLLIMSTTAGAATSGANSSTVGATIWYPQFQLLMAMVAIERHEFKTKKNEAGGRQVAFARKPTDATQSKHISEMLQELFRDIGISKYDENVGPMATQYIGQPENQLAAAAPSSSSSSIPNLPPIDGANNPNSNNINATTGRSLFSGTVTQPTVTRPQDMYTAQGSHTRQAMLLRMEHLFDEVESKLMQELPTGAAIVLLLTPPADFAGGDTFDSMAGKGRLPSKPVVISDALPVPAHCPETIEQLLEASLGHHNLGAFEESLKFLEAARVQLDEVVTTQTGHSLDQHIAAAKKHMHANSNAVPKEPPPYFDVLMYIIICKGNVYQSCGDDEQSLLQYMDAWHKSHHFRDRDWEIVAINAAGVLAFYSLRYEVATLCFHLVHAFRETAYGLESPDTATALNNEAAALYCISRRAEARLRFEKSWNVLTKVLGHRAPRAITVWKNLEKARRAQGSLANNKKDMRETLAMRPDADRLIMGGTFTIQALPPPEPKKKKKGGGGKGGKKKKK